jgi:drug/metabolite transporter (DMT)-like permease
MESVSAGVLTVALLVTAAGVPFLRGRVFPQPGALAWAAGSGLCEGFYFLSLVQALRRAPLGWSYTWMRGGAVLLVWPLSVLFLGEGFGLPSAFWVALVCAGLALLGLAPGQGGSPKALGWAGLAGVFIGGFTVCYKLALSRGAHPVGLFATSMAISLPVQLAYRIRRSGLARTLALPRQRGLVLLAGFLCIASFLLYLQALRFSGAGSVATLRNTSVVFAVFFSWILGETPSPRQWAGAFLVAAGAAGLAWLR